MTKNTNMPVGYHSAPSCCDKSMEIKWVYGSTIQGEEYDGWRDGSRIHHKVIFQCVRCGNWTRSNV